jgi:prolyl-tRNA synthetase
VTIGARGLAAGTVELTRRATGETTEVPVGEITDRVLQALAG